MNTSPNRAPLAEFLMVARWGIGMDEMSGDHKGWLIMSFNKPALERFNVEAVLVAFLESLTRASSLGLNNFPVEDKSITVSSWVS